MFSRKHPVLFVSKDYIDPGQVTLSQEPLFEGGEACAYTLETLSETMRQIPGVIDQSVRIVLSEELVYVTALSFPRGTKLTREMVRMRAEETIPENLRATEWDFRTMRFVKHTETGDVLSVQVAVVEHTFSQALEKALQSGGFSVDSILPESYVLASFEATEEGLTVIIEQNRESVLFMAALRGLVLMTVVKPGIMEEASLEKFLLSVTEYTGEKAARVIGSHLVSSEPLERLAEKGYSCFQKEYNPLIGIFAEKISGKDETVLNLNIFSQHGLRWWQRLWQRKSS